MSRPMNPASTLFPAWDRADLCEADGARFLGMDRPHGGPVVEVNGPIASPLPMNPASVVFPKWRGFGRYGRPLK